MGPETELWNIYTYYTLHGMPYPDLLKASQFVKFCKDCRIVRSLDNPSGVTTAIANVVYTAEVKRRDRKFNETQAQMTYNDFQRAHEALDKGVHGR